MEKISCRYLQRAVFYAPDELRHCCKRYFHKGKLMGDAKIFPVKKTADISIDKIIDAKKILIDKINRGEKTECLGCPVLEKKDWLEVKDEKFDHISIEHNARCNMRCSYCSETYYGGKVAQYDILHGLNELVDKNKIRSDAQVAWGGGEPVMSKDFEELIKFVNNKVKPKTQRFFSNAIVFSEDIAVLMKKNIASITVSVDAGSVDTFKIVRGVNQYKKVLSNIKRYYDYSKNNIVIKYIFTEQNSTKEEVQGFVNDIEKHGLSQANFLISSNYKDESLTLEQGFLIIYLHHLLTKQGSTTCVLDDQVRPRICKITKGILDTKNIKREFQNEMKDLILKIKDTQRSTSEIIVWGIGEYANLLLNNSVTFSNSKVKFFVDSNPHKQGTKFRNSIVLKPEEVKKYNNPILIASSFWYHEIVDQLSRLGVDQKRVLSSSLI